MVCKLFQGGKIKNSAPWYVLNQCSLWKHKRGKKYWKLNEISLVYFNLFFLSLFILRERDRERKGQRERGGERIPSRLHTVSTEPKAGLELMNHEIMTWAEIQSWLLNWLSHPGAPIHFLLGRDDGCLVCQSLWSDFSASLLLSDSSFQGS